MLFSNSGIYISLCLYFFLLFFYLFHLEFHLRVHVFKKGLRVPFNGAIQVSFLSENRCFSSIEFGMFLEVLKLRIFSYFESSFNSLECSIQLLELDIGSCFIIVVQDFSWFQFYSFVIQFKSLIEILLLILFIALVFNSFVFGEVRARMFFRRLFFLRWLWRRNIGIIVILIFFFFFHL